MISAVFERKRRFRCNPAPLLSGFINLSESTKVLLEFCGYFDRQRRNALACAVALLSAIETVGLVCAAQEIPIQHVVIIIKENRSFDNIFGKFPGANGKTVGYSNGIAMPLKEDAVVSKDLPHGWGASPRVVNGGKMDGFCSLVGSKDCDASKHPQVNNANHSPYVQFWQRDIPNYWTYAQDFVLADNFFSSSYGQSFPNHVYFAAADAYNIIDNPSQQVGPGAHAWGCDSEPGTTVPRIDPATNKRSFIFPCFDIPTLPDSLDAAGRSWRYYAATASQYGYVWSVLDSINHIRNGSEWTTNVLPVDNLISDINSGDLADVTYVTPVGPDSDHPPDNVCTGERWLVGVVNAIMQSKFNYWNNTVIFVTWDDFGGYYDHVPPPTVDFFGMGLRVPLLIISPYVKAGTVQHGLSEFSSLLSFVEKVYDLPPLTKRDQKANNLMDAFDFTQSPLAPVVLTPKRCSTNPGMRAIQAIGPDNSDDGD